MLLALLFAFFAGFALVLGLMPIGMDSRPKLQLNMEPLDGLALPMSKIDRKKGPLQVIFSLLAKLAIINIPLAASPAGRRAFKDLGMAKSSLTVEEFFLIKEILIVFFLLLVVKFNASSDLFLFWFLMSFAAGYMFPEMWLKARIRKIKGSILRNLPDTVDLLGLCVNAGLDFMMALKYVVEKSKPSPIIEELNNMMQEIKVGKPRRDALRDLAKKYEMPDLSTFARTLIQADRMGTSVIEALNILSEDMREARYRRGEAMALKAPLKMLVPLLFFIFPVVAILVAGPVFLDFFQNNPLKGLGR
jgi:pilus assembly protein TadC